ncbi:hypothetical protein HYV74_03250 [Candidatus Uhrbacteria bacterium]|nr:hypothetical protein [Candidatus Uhrbacteria bacterium]
MTKERQQPLTQVSADQLGEIARICKANRGAGGPGIGPDVQGFIRRMTEGGTNPGKKDPRETQAFHLWTLGIGDQLGYTSFAEYLATVPRIPEFPDRYFAQFPNLVLVDARLTARCYAKLGGFVLVNGLEKETRPDDYNLGFVPYGSIDPGTHQYWMRANLRGFAEHSMHDVRDMISDDTVPCSLLEGIAGYLQHPTRMRNARTALGGSVWRKERHSIAALYTLASSPVICAPRFDDPVSFVAVRGAFIG